MKDETKNIEINNKSTDGQNKKRKRSSSKNESHKKERRRHHKKSSLKIRILSWVLTIVIFMIIVYCSMGYIVYADAFMPGTTVQGVDVGSLSVSECEAKLNDMLQDYSLAIKKDGNAVESIKLSDVKASVSDDLSKQIREAVSSQNKLIWGLGYIKNINDIQLNNIIEISDEGYEKFITNSVGYNLPATVESSDQSIIFENGKFEVSDPVYGDEIDKEVYSEKIKQAILNMDREIDIKDADCYTKPKETTDKSKYEGACRRANEMIDYGSLKLNIDGEDSGLEKEIIESSLVIDEDFNVKLDKDTISDAVNKISDKYNTLGGNRKFNTSHGTVVEVEGGDFGRSLNLDGVEDLVYSALFEGEDKEKTLPYKQNLYISGSDTIGNTYIEIDLTNQYVWEYIDGKLTAETPCITGLAGGSRETPQGVYTLKNKAMDVPLVGSNYVTPVKYWMPFNGGIGLHDAVWQSNFGGELYKTKGSHGCVNLPMDKAELIYKNAVVNMPVVAYYTQRDAERFKAVPSTGMVAGQYRALTASEKTMLANIKAGRSAGAGAVIDSAAQTNNRVETSSAIE